MIDFTLPRLIKPEGLKPRLGLLVLSRCQPPGQFHLSARCFLGFLHRPMDGEKQAMPGMHGIEKDMYMFTRI